MPINPPIIFKAILLILNTVPKITDKATCIITPSKKQVNKVSFVLHSKQ